MLQLACAACCVFGPLAVQAQLAPTTQPRPGDLPQQTAKPVKIEQAWIRARLPGQDITVGYMTLTAEQAAQLVGASSTAAGSVELHEMKMDGDVMRMRAIDSVALPAGQPVELKSGGYHLMLLDLKTPLANNTSAPLVLRFKDASGREFKEEMKVPVSTAAPAANLTGPAKPAAK
ncbi:MAG: copper chaperone PCu(A)C [Burkholderiales bacterium]